MENLCFAGPSHSRQEYNLVPYPFLYKLGTYGFFM